MANNEDIRLVTEMCTVKRLKEILSLVKDDGQLVFGVNGLNINNKLVTHVKSNGIVLEFVL